tara:strand:- start:3410 stop:4030 length:621 start_codon:yes stop_codon:yes gene_type:complete
MLNKKAAMFGLDARIALAIFGALSVISGAALYSAISSAQAEKWRQTFTEIVKATEQYYLDNGKTIPAFNSHFNPLYLNDLVANRESLSTWNGPYLSHNVEGSVGLSDALVKTLGSGATLGAYLRTGADWAEANDMNSDGLCTMNASDCYEWISIYGDSSTNTEQLFTSLDNLVDNGDGELKGDVRLVRYMNFYLMFKGIPHKRTLY